MASLLVKKVKDLGGSSLVYFSNNSGDNLEMAENLYNKKGKPFNSKNAKTILGEIDIEGHKITRITYRDKGYNNLRSQLVDNGINSLSVDNWIKQLDNYSFQDDPIGELFKLVEENNLEPRKVLGDIVIFQDGESGVEVAMFSDVANSLKNVQAIPYIGTQKLIKLQLNTTIREPCSPLRTILYLCHQTSKETTDKMPNSMPVEQFRNYLTAQGVKKEELKWTFIDELLDGKTKITKQEGTRLGCLVIPSRLMKFLEGSSRWHWSRSSNS